MASAGSFQSEVRQLLRDRVLEAARDLVVERGWARVSMSEIAERVGVSRQAVYKEMGAKHALGEALVARETDAFLSGVAQQLRAHPDDVVAGMTAAAEFVLLHGADNALLRAIAAPAPGHDLGLLPLLTVQGDVLARTVDAVIDVLVELHAPVLDDGPGLRAAVESAVRLTLSHMLQPLASPPATAAQLRPVLAQLLQLALPAATPR